jgi:hypothetical protein
VVALGWSGFAVGLFGTGYFPALGAEFEAAA